MIDVILATPELTGEPELVTAAPACGVHVVRRCVDAVDLIAAAAVDECLAVVLSAGLPRLSGDVVARLGSRTVIGIARDPLDSTMLDGLGVLRVLAEEPDPSSTWRAVRDLVVAGCAGSPPPDANGVWTTGVWAPEVEPPRAVSAGALIAVWGPIGSPGRTTIAMGVSEALAEAGRRVCLVDADTYGPSIAMELGIAADSGGIVRACRLADSGILDESSVLSSTRRVRGTWHVLAGVPTADRWSELNPASVDRVWQSLREAFDVTVVDVGFCLEQETAAAAWSRRRNVAALSAVATSDHLVAVADGSARGAARLATAWATLESASSAPATIVRNRSRRHSSQWDEAVTQFGISGRICIIPSDAKAVEACWSRGRSLGEVARRSPLRRSLRGLAGELMSG